MQAKSKPWFRMYVDAVDDEKLRLLAFEDRWHFVAILCLKRAGLLDAGDTLALLDRKMAVKLGLGDRELGELRRRLMEVGLIDERWQPLGWEGRQYESDTSTDRVRRFRDKQGTSSRDSGAGLRQPTNPQPENGCSTPADDETAMKRFRNVSETAPDTETESDTESEEEPKGSLTRACAREAGAGWDGGAPDNEPGQALGNPIHDWRKVPGIDRQAFSDWLDYLDEIGKRVSASTQASMAKAMAWTGDAEHQRQLVEFHRKSGWKNITSLTPEQLADRIRARNGDSPKTSASSGDTRKPGKFERLMEGLPVE